MTVGVELIYGAMEDVQDVACEMQLNWRCNDKATEIASEPNEVGGIEYTVWPLQNIDAQNFLFLLQKQNAFGWFGWLVGWSVLEGRECF